MKTLNTGETYSVKSLTISGLTKPIFELIALDTLPTQRPDYVGTFSRLTGPLTLIREDIAVLTGQAGYPESSKAGTIGSSALALIGIVVWVANLANLIVVVNNVAIRNVKATASATSWVSSELLDALETFAVIGMGGAVVGQACPGVVVDAGEEGEALSAIESCVDLAVVGEAETEEHFRTTGESII